MENIRAKIKRRFSHKEPNANFDDHDSADEETHTYLHKELEDAEKSDEPHGKPGSLLNRMIMHGNKKTEEQLAAENAAKGQGGQSAQTSIQQASSS